MDGLKENFNRKIQIFEDKCLVKFTHKECTMYDNTRKIVVKGTRSKIKYYYVGNSPSLFWNKANLSIEELWH